MIERCSAADTAADTGHALDEVLVQLTELGLEQCCLARLNAVAGLSLDLKVQTLLLDDLEHSLGQTA